jgi:hypothetical protein
MVGSVTLEKVAVTGARWRRYWREKRGRWKNILVNVD